MCNCQFPEIHLIIVIVIAKIVDVIGNCNDYILDIIVTSLVDTLHILQPFILTDANHNNLLLVDNLHLLQTPRLEDIFHNNLFLLLLGTLRVPMVGNTLHNNLCLSWIPSTSFKFLW